MELPSVLKENTFDSDGYITKGNKKMVPAYAASQLGFSQKRQEQLQRRYKRWKDISVFPICPFSACEEFLDMSKLETCEGIEDIIEFWDSFNRLIGKVNYTMLMPRSRLLIADLDFGIDDGVAAEIGYFAARYGGAGEARPIIGLASDARLSPSASFEYFLGQGPFNARLARSNDELNEILKKPLEPANYDYMVHRVRDLGIAKKRVKAYVTSQLGYSEDNEDLTDFYASLKRIGIEPICCFDIPKNFPENVKEGKRIHPKYIYGEIMEKSDFMIAIMDGSHAVCPEVALDIGYYAAMYDKPIIGIRDDFRLAENPASTINVAVRYFMDIGPYNGSFHFGPAAYRNALEELERVTQFN